MSVGLDTQPTATTYDVETLVHKVWRGEIRVPHFQRDFRWSREDVRRLLDSIVRGYPVGNLLLWIRPAPAGSLELGALNIDAPEIDRALWVVDGQQRITSLANVLHEDGHSDQRFNLAYDLRAKTFVPRPATEDPYVIPLPVIFDLQRILKWFAKYPDIAEFLDHATGITKRLRQFPIPASQVEIDDPEVLQDIFDRMNNYGKRLSRAEVFSALYASDESRVNDSLTIGLIARNIDTERQFGVIDDDTVLRAILARRDPDVTRDIHHEFDANSRRAAAFPGENSRMAYEAGGEALLKAVSFVQDTAGVPHFSFLPYRFLIVALARLFAHHPELDQRNLRLLRRWFWRAAVVGPYIYRGSATGAMKAMTYRITSDSLSESVLGLIDAVDRTDHPLPDVGRFRTNEGAGKIMLCSFWALEPRHLDSGELIERSQLAECLGERSTAANAVGYIIPARALTKDQRLWAADRILQPTEDGPPPEIDSLIARRKPVDLDEETWHATLTSHAIRPTDTAMIADGNVNRFLIQRQAALTENLRVFLDRMCEWSFEDTPSLKDLVVQDEESEDSDEYL